MLTLSIDPSGDLLEVSQAWQHVISEQTDPIVKNQIGAEITRGPLGGSQTFRGTRKVILKSELAFMLPDGLSQEELAWPVLYFNDVVAKGELGKVTFVRLNESGLITWAIHHAQVINTAEVVLDEDLAKEPAECDYYLPADRAVPRPLYMPVGFIHYALAAA